jgi:hypothetical protein
MSAPGPKRPPKPVLLFAAHAIALALLIGLWPTPRAAYPGLFRAHANALVRPWDVRLEPPVAADPASGVDTVMQGSAWRSSFSVERLGWWPSAALVALLLATPLSPLRRASAALIGLALLDAFALARIAVEIAYLNAEVAQVGGAALPSALRVLLRVGSESLTASIPSAAAVFVCWVALARPRSAIDLAPLARR